MLKEYTFKLTYEIPLNIQSVDKLIDNLYSNGCDDAIIGIGAHGKIGLEFIRSGKSMEAAIKSAHRDVLRCLLQELNAK